VSYQPEISSLAGLWTYRSFIADPDLATAFNDLEFGRGNIKVDEAPFGIFRGRIYDTGWSLELNGAIQYGTPFQIRFQGKGVVGGEEWIYDYLGSVVAPWPNGVNQRPAIVGTIVRTIPHSSNGTAIAPAGVVAQWIAVRQDNPS